MGRLTRPEQGSEGSTLNGHPDTWTSQEWPRHRGWHHEGPHHEWPHHENPPHGEHHPQGPHHGPYHQPGHHTWGSENGTSTLYQPGTATGALTHIHHSPSHFPKTAHKATASAVPSRSASRSGRVVTRTTKVTIVAGPTTGVGHTTAGAKKSRSTLVTKARKTSAAIENLSKVTAWL